jgi:hypothetical protein
MNRKYTTAWQEAAWIFGLSRLTILVSTYLVISCLPITPPLNNSALFIGPRRCSFYNLTCFLLSGWRWDTAYYAMIAHNGYTSAPLAVFFPLFPLLIRGVGFLLGGSMMADYAAGLLAANGCFYGALVLFYHLVAKDLGHQVAKYALVYLAFACYGVFFYVGYTESLFLLLTLATFCLLRGEKILNWWLAGGCGFLTTLTRPTGIILVVPFLVLFVQRFGLRTFLRREQWWHKLNALLSMALVPAGLLTYMLYQWRVWGNPWLFATEQTRVWERFVALPWVGFIDAIQLVISGGPLAGLTDAVFTLATLVALALGWKLLPQHYRLYCLTMILFVLCEPSLQEGLMSVPRFLLVLFPIYILFAMWSKDRRVACWLMIPSVIFFVVHAVMLLASYRWVA